MDSPLSLHRSTSTQEFDVDTVKLSKLVVHLLKILFPQTILCARYGAIIVVAHRAITSRDAGRSSGVGKCVDLAG